MKNECSLVINDDFILKLKCTHCGSIGKFEEKASDTYDSMLFCKNCGSFYYFRDGILSTLTKFNYGYWDTLYSKGVKGNSVQGSKLVHLVEKTLNNLPHSLLYFALVDLLRRSKTTFQVSIELGCGTGVYSLLLKKMRIIDVPILVDMSLSALKIAQDVFEALGEKAIFVLADATNLPFANKSFDLSLSGGLIEHFEGASQRKIISEHGRIVTNVVCQFPAPTPFYWFQRGCVNVLNFGWPFGYEVPLSCSRVKQLFQMEGFGLCSNSYHDMISTLLTRAALPFGSLTLLKRKGLINKLTATEIVAHFVREDS